MLYRLSNEILTSYISIVELNHHLLDESHYNDFTLNYF